MDMFFITMQVYHVLHQNVSSQYFLPGVSHVSSQILGNLTKLPNLTVGSLG